MAKVSKGVIGKQALGLPLLLLTTAAWFVTLVGLAISAHDGEKLPCFLCVTGRCSAAVLDLDIRVHPQEVKADSDSFGSCGLWRASCYSSAFYT